jgi:hypothetical protein
VRYRFGPVFAHALRIRGLDVGTVAVLAGVSPATVSSAVRGGSVNLSTATRIAKVVSHSPVIRELEEWSADGPDACAEDNLLV